VAVTSVVSRSQLEDTLRLDAEYYQLAYLETESRIIETGSYVPWGHIGGHFITGPFGSEFIIENYVAEGSHRYVRGQDVKEFFLVDTDNVYIPGNDYKRLSKYALAEGDILISVVGTLGNAAVVDKTVTPAIFSCKSTLFRSATVNPFYLIAYLNCRFGRILLQRKVRGAVQTGLNIDDLRSLPVFIAESPLQDQIGNLVMNAKEHYDRSKSVYSQAENLLLKELGLKNFKPKYELSYSANLSKTFAAHRVDAEYFQSIYDYIQKYLINEFGARSIGEVDFIEVTTGQYSEEYVEKSQGKPYIRGIDIKNGTINTDDLVYIASGDQTESKKARGGDVVVTRVGTIGLSARIPRECEGGTISDNLIRLRFNEKRLDSHYVALFLGSPIGASLMIRNSRGSVQQRLNQETLKEVVVPFLPSETQKKIASLVQKSHEARKKAKELLEEAKSKVENLIEGRA